MVEVNLSERNARKMYEVTYWGVGNKINQGVLMSMLLEIFQLLQRHGNGLEKVEREV